MAKVEDEHRTDAETEAMSLKTIIPVESLWSSVQSKI